MKNFLKLEGFVDTTAASIALQLHPELWNAHNSRKDYERSPHRQTSDIWVRTAEKREDFAQPHWPVWYPAYKQLPALRPIIFALMARVEATHLGGVLITRIPAGARVLPHADTGWHPRHFGVKLYVPLASNDKCVFRVEDEEAVMRVGEVWWIDNTRVHEVINDGDTDRETLIICMRAEE